MLIGDFGLVLVVAFFGQKERFFYLVRISVDMAG